MIEDDVDLANIFAEALQAADFDTEIIAAGDVALNRLKTVVPLVVVLDLHLPRVSGMEILPQIRSDARLAKTRVIVASADPVMADSMADIADLVLIKPISFGQLRDMAARLKPAASGFTV
ncbi:MAG: response regulator [Anaerolineae bacterium]